MEWISNNWIFLLIAALFIGMHLFGYGCGAHGKHGKEECDEHKACTVVSGKESKGEKKGHGCCG